MKPARAALAPLARDFASFGDARLLVAVGLMVAGTLAEGIGILLLVPAILGMFGPSHAGADPFSMLPGGGSLPSILAFFALLVAIRGGIVLARERLTSRLQVAFVEAVRLRLVERLTRAAWSQVAELSHARIVQALSVEIHQVGIAVNSLMAATAATVIVAGTALLAMAVAPLAALIAFTIAGLTYLPMRRMLGRIRRLGESITHRHFGMTENAIDFLASLKPVAAEGTGRAYLEQQRLLSDAAVEDRVAFASLHARAKELSVGLTAIAAIALVGAGVAMGFSAPGLLALLLMLSRMSGPVGEVQRGIQQLMHSLPAYERLRELEDMLQPGPAPAPSADPPADGAILSLEQISFSRGGRDILRGFSLPIAPDSMIGIAGPSGVGKTTLLDLMAGVLTPDTGCVRRRGADRTAFANHLAYVGQDPVLGGRTLRESLSWSNDAEAPDMIQALHIVGAGPLLERLGGLDALLGERGAMISGGERQRIGLARALLRRPQLLLLDEALNALDTNSERNILVTLAGLEPRPAIVIVAHRPEAFALCRQIIRLSRHRPPSIENHGQVAPRAHEVSV
ncbi:ATP-binding cassette domain-containing protein [Sphingomonas koreensis]